jgi:NAD(P)-dependent dehydrogenase (short-subunit alcohol dehydrogenase family)
MRLEGKVAVITGGGQGIGRAVALRFAREGCDVAIYDVSLELGEKVAGEIRLLGRRALVIKCDVSNSEEVHQATQGVLDKFKRVDILVNNAGISVPALIEETTDALWVTTNGKEVMFLDRRWQRLNRVQFVRVTGTKKLAR